MSTPDHPNITRLCHDLYAVGQKIWEIGQVCNLTNTQISQICTNAKNDRLNNYKHLAVLVSLCGL
jgi:hypothetical protein